MKTRDWLGGPGGAHFPSCGRATPRCASGAAILPDRQHLGRWRIPPGVRAYSAQTRRGWGSAWSQHRVRLATSAARATSLEMTEHSRSSASQCRGVATHTGHTRLRMTVDSATNQSNRRVRMPGGRILTPRAHACPMPPPRSGPLAQSSTHSFLPAFCGRHARPVSHPVPSKIADRHPAMPCRCWVGAHLDNGHRRF